MSDERAALRAAFLSGIEDEIERRRAARTGVSAGGAKARLLATLDEMRERLRSDPDFVEPSKAGSRHTVRELETWLRGRGYLNRCS